MVRALLSSGLLLMMFSAFFFALTDVVIKFLSPAITATEIAFFRFFVGVAVLVLLMVPRGISLKGDRTWVLLVRGVSGTLTFMCLLKSISLIPLANAMVLFYTFPVFAVFFSFLLFREPVGLGEIVLIVMGMVGIYVLLNPGAHQYNRGDVFALLGGCLAGFTVVLVRKLRETNGPLTIYFYFCLVGGLLCFPPFLREFRLPSLGQFILLVLLGFLFLAAQLFMNQGFKFCKASEGSVIMMSELVFVGIAGVLIFNEGLSTGFLVGAFLILSSGVGLNLIHRRFRRLEVTRKS
jgi:drug/metabolite transporter (DMT)-like permease